MNKHKFEESVFKILMFMSMTIVVVTHLLRQAHRLADYVIFLWMGSLVESGPAEQVFNRSKDERTRAYLSGTIG
jgi:phosphate transport system ATP-binding protein